MQKSCVSTASENATKKKKKKSVTDVLSCIHIVLVNLEKTFWLDIICNNTDQLILHMAVQLCLNTNYSVGLWTAM